MMKPKSITQLSKEQLEDMCLNLMHIDNEKAKIIEMMEEDIRFCINNMKNEYACTDSRTNRELHTMVKILEETLERIN